MLLLLTLVFSVIHLNLIYRTLYVALLFPQNWRCDILCLIIYHCYYIDYILMCNFMPSLLLIFCFRMVGKSCVVLRVEFCCCILGVNLTTAGIILIGILYYIQHIVIIVMMSNSLNFKMLQIFCHFCMKWHAVFSDFHNVICRFCLKI